MNQLLTAKLPIDPFTNRPIVCPCLSVSEKLNNTKQNFSKLGKGIKGARKNPKDAALGVGSSLLNGGLNTAKMVLTSMSYDPNNTWNQLGSTIDWTNEKIQTNVTDPNVFEAYSTIGDAGQMALGAKGLLTDTKSLLSGFQDLENASGAYQYAGTGFSTKDFVSGEGSPSNIIEATSGNGSGAGKVGNGIPKIGSKTGYQFKEGIDLDLRGTGKNYKDALNEAFNRTGVPKENFKVSEWAKDANGKSFPVKWESKGGGEVNIDIAHAKEGTPDVPHVGYQTPGKRGTAGGVRGHIFVDDVPVNR